MLGVIDMNMIDILKSKLCAIQKAIKTLLMKTNYIKDFIARFNNNHAKNHPSRFLILKINSTSNLRENPFV